MKKTLAALLLIVGFAFGIAQNAQAESKDKAITISGKGCCAKCCLKETDACQNAVTVEKDGKKTVYYLVQNDVSKEFHGNICKEIKEVTATGTCKKLDGKLQFTASKIEVSK